MTRTEEELLAAYELVARLEAKKREEDEAKAATTPAVRGLAVALHGKLCTNPHPVGCDWYRDATADDPEAADWTQEDHQWWLNVTRFSLGWMVGNGWKVTPPGATEPLPAPPTN
ncbi:hypothetical protein [Archangium lansingense]|uniref:Uncharacterized protein n=1 Tax=Archangium lansingense TaxID=2995310 RepID=A0ABT4AF31_9BACT|nr:hypothetical protein [Archangium lansinium]MCY1080297.1 hypothetical protein [Archangium lansinium]